MQMFYNLQGLGDYVHVVRESRLCPPCKNHLYKNEPGGLVQVILSYTDWVSACNTACKNY